MDETRRSLVVPIETANRELDAKLLLACVAAERGFRVYLGSKREVDMWASRFPRSIYLQKAVTKASLRMYEILESLGHWIVSNDEEGLIYFSRQEYWKNQVHPETLRRARALLAWGPENAEAWRSHPAYHGIPIEVCGNPRIDLLRPELADYFENEVREIRERLGKFALVNTNFTYVNHFIPRFNIVSGAGAESEGDDFLVGAARHGAILFRAFTEMVPALARACPQRTIVVRPHPSENQEPWHELAAGLSNVHVTSKGGIVAWLHAADVVVHNGCTTALEAYVMGTPAIAYQPATSDRFDLDLPNHLSHRATDLAELAKLFDAACDGTLRDSDAAAARKRELIERHVTGSSGPLVCERVIEALERAWSEFSAGPPAPAWRRAFGRVHAAGRRLSKRINQYRDDHINSRAYMSHKFPTLEQPAVEERLARFRRVLGRFEGVSVRPHSENIFELEQSG
jgi:surface carbohydrate biosynthesis protein